jgi:hypothetical protein
MELSEYYNIVKSKIESGDYNIYYYQDEKVKDINTHLEAINYLQWEFMSDRNDQRIDKVFGFVCIPNNVNSGEINIDFSNYSVEDFLKEIMKLKD